MPIVWRDQMSVGNTIIDDEHKHLICLINSVEIALQTEDHGNMIRFLVHQLYLYTKNHFTQEEGMMIEARYSEYNDHKLQHQKILEDIEHLQLELERHFKKKALEKSYGSETEEEQEVNAESESQENTESSDESSKEIDIENELVSLLRSWIIDHVLSTDQKLKPLFA